MRLILCSISLFISCYACNPPAPPAGQFCFKPQPSKVYHIKWKEETTSNWTCQGEKKSSDKEETTVSLQLISFRDSLYQMKLTFDHFIINREPAFTLNTQDSTVSGNGISKSILTKWNYWVTLARGSRLMSGWIGKARYKPLPARIS